MLGPSGLGQDDDAAPDRRLRAARRGDARARTASTSAGSPPYEREVNTVFQDYALFPHMTVRENVAYGLRSRASAKRERARARRRGAAHGAARRTSASASRSSSRAASASASRSPARSSTARACCCSTSRSARSTSSCARRCSSSSRRIQRELSERITFIYVTHDQDEALTMSDRIAVFSDGRARAGRHARRDLRAPGERVRRRLRRHVERDRARRPRAFTVRPEKIRLLDGGRRPVPGGAESASRGVREVVYLGSVTRYVVDLDERRDAGRRCGRTSTRRRARRSRSAAGACGWRGRRSTPIERSAADEEEEQQEEQHCMETQRCDAGVAMAVVACGGASPSRARSGLRRRRTASGCAADREQQACRRRSARARASST